MLSKWHIIILVGLILVIDQSSKIYVKTHFLLGESVQVFSWFQILFIENKGAAWGLKLPGEWGKLTLTIFRIFAVGLIGYWLSRLLHSGKDKYMVISVALIFAGAIGNIIDSVFYGMIFNDSHFEVARLFSEEPYSTLLHGKVVDMLSFPIIDTYWPSWFPIWGGQPFTFFQYVFNVSDAAITVGGVTLFFALRKDKNNFPKSKSIDANSLS